MESISDPTAASARWKMKSDSGGWFPNFFSSLLLLRLSDFVFVVCFSTAPLISLSTSSLSLILILSISLLPPLSLSLSLFLFFFLLLFLFLFFSPFFFLLLSNFLLVCCIRWGSVCIRSARDAISFSDSAKCWMSCAIVFLLRTCRRCCAAPPRMQLGAMGTLSRTLGSWKRLETPGTRPRTIGNVGALGTQLCGWEWAVIREGARNAAGSAQSFRFLLFYFTFLVYFQRYWNSTN